MFISFEGGEGAGKTTHLKWMAAQLESLKIPFIVTREPGGTPFGEEIRDILLKHRHERVDELAELLLMFAARAQHVDAIIRPALAAGRWVLCDRFIDASYAYQGGGRGVKIAEIENLERLVLKGLKPDRVLLFDLPPAVGLKRVHHRGHADRFEQEKQIFFERVRSAYLERAKQDPSRYVIIDASAPLEAVQQHVSNIFNHTLKNLHV